MSRVLLAVEGVISDRKVLKYSLDLCRRLRARLDILQILQPKEVFSNLQGIVQRSKVIGKVFQNSLVAASMAEAGDHKSALQILDMVEKEARQEIENLINNSSESTVEYSVSTSIGNPADEVLKYVNKRHDVILMVYDSPENHKKRTQKSYPRNFRKLKKHLPVPVVLVSD